MKTLIKSVRFIAVVLLLSPLLSSVHAEKHSTYTLPLYTISDPGLVSVFEEKIHPFIDSNTHDVYKILTCRSAKTGSETLIFLIIDYFDMETLREKVGKGEFQGCSKVGDILLLHYNTSKIIQPQADSLDITGYFDMKQHTDTDSIIFVVQNFNLRREQTEFRLTKIKTNAYYNMTPKRFHPDSEWDPSYRSYPPRTEF